MQRSPLPLGLCWGEGDEPRALCGGGDVRRVASTSIEFQARGSALVTLGLDDLGTCSSCRRRELSSAVLGVIVTTLKRETAFCEPNYARF